MAGNGRPAFFIKAAFPACAHPESTLNAAPPDPRGEVPEWSNGAVSKTVEPSRVPRVRIPVSPPLFTLITTAPERRRDVPCAALCGGSQFYTHSVKPQMKLVLDRTKEFFSFSKHPAFPNPHFPNMPVWPNAEKQPDPLAYPLWQRWLNYAPVDVSPILLSALTSANLALSPFMIVDCENAENSFTGCTSMPYADDSKGPVQRLSSTSNSVNAVRRWPSAWR